jgi:adenosine kinase
MAGLCEGTLLGMGNPLLDIMAVVDEGFLAKYDLKANNAILAEEKHVPIYEDLKKNYKVEYCAGGATQNVMRIAQWVLDKPNIATFMGAVGNDENGKIIAESARADGVNVNYQIVPTEPTGTCAVLITGENRSLCAYLGAANHFKKEVLVQPENWKFVEKAKFYYISGFFLTVSPDSLQLVAEYAASQNRTFMMNLSAPFISQFFIDPLSKAFPYVDIIFGNESEAVAFSEAMKFGTTDITEISIKTAALPKANKQKPRIVVFTQGADPVILVQGTCPPTVNKFPVIKISSDQIKDTNGAGDAFCGGFISQYIQGNHGQDFQSCVQCGVWAATEVIQQLGCKYPKDKKYNPCP